MLFYLISTCNAGEGADLLLQITFTLFVIFTLVGVQHGTGHHRSDLSDADFEIGMKVRPSKEYLDNEILTPIRSGGFAIFGI